MCCQLFAEHAWVVKIIVKYYSGFKDEIRKDIKAEIVSFQKQCKVLNERIKIIDELAGPETCSKTHEAYRGARSLVKKLIKISSTTDSAELR